jgi:hypothetical protein
MSSSSSTPEARAPGNACKREALKIAPERHRTDLDRLDSNRLSLVLMEGCICLVVKTLIRVQIHLIAHPLASPNPMQAKMFKKQ